MIDSASPRSGRYRWTVCALLFAATTICYMDRQVLGLLKPVLVEDLRWTETDYGDIVATFSLLYALGYALGGRMMDRIGVKKGLPLAVGAWSLSAAAHGLVSSVIGFKIVRGALGLTEGGNFPAAIKTVREWFPVQERALATGLFNAGSNVGAVVTPIALPFVVAFAGWRFAFLLTGALGLIWLVGWVYLYDIPERQRRLSAGELAYIRSGPAESAERPSWLSLLTYRGTWAYAVGMLMTSPVWWFYLNWVPGFLNARFGTDMMASIGPLVTIYLLADVGSIGGGWMSSSLIGRGVRPIRARLLTMLLMACCVIPVAFVSQVNGLWQAVLLISLAAAAHQGLSANLYTIVSDTMPAGAVSSVVGIGGFAAGIMGMFVAMAVGRILDATHGQYLILFIGAAAAYPVAVALMAIILPRDQTVESRPDAGLRTHILPSDQE